MEIALSLRSFSYYTSSESVYIQGTVFKKIDIESDQKRDRHFEDVKPNTKISFKTPDCTPELLKLLLSERILKIRSKEVLKPIDSTRAVTFVADSISPCAI